jgi:hypothetical protein
VQQTLEVLGGLQGHIAANPVRKVRAPKRPIDPEARFGRARRRTLDPEEFGRLLAAVPPFYCDHFLTQVGTGSSLVVCPGVTNPKITGK